jgi:hypothetical protein
VGDNKKRIIDKGDMEIVNEIVIPTFGISNKIREKIEQAKQKMEQCRIDIDNNCYRQQVTIFENIGDCDIDNLNGISYAFFETFSNYVGHQIPQILSCDNGLCQRNFPILLNNAIFISMSVLTTENPIRHFVEYRNLAGGWKKREYIGELTYNNGEYNLVALEDTYDRDEISQNIIFAMVYCLCVRHEKNTKNSKLDELLNFIYNSHEDIGMLVKQVFSLETPSWNSPSSSLDKTDTDTNDDNTNNPEQNIEKKREKAIKAIGKVIKESFGDNQKKFQPAQWSAIHEVYKKEVEDITAKDFVRLMTKRGINKGSMASAISRGGRIILHLENDPRKWVELRETEKKESLKMQIDVALRLIELLDDPSI